MTPGFSGFPGLTQDTGTLANGTLTLQVLNSQTGTLGTDMFTPATQDDFNKAALKLSNQAGADNSAAVQAQQQASQASANAAAEQQAQKELATMQGIGFTSDLNSLGGDATTANNGLGTVKSDAANGQGSDCSNADTVESDFDGVVSDSDGLTSDLDTFTADVSSARAGDQCAAERPVRPVIFQPVRPVGCVSSDYHGAGCDQLRDHHRQPGD